MKVRYPVDEAFVENDHLAAVFHFLQVGGLQRDQLERVIGALAPLHQNVLQPHLFHFVHVAVDDGNVLQQEICEPLALQFLTISWTMRYFGQKDIVAGLVLA